jgi:hypothetical protein
MSAAGPEAASRAGQLARDSWLALWRAMRVYHRYEVRDFERLRRPRGALLVGYHGRPIAFDMCMLTSVIHERLGYLPHGVVHRSLVAHRWSAAIVDALGFVAGDGPAIAYAVERGEHLLVQPGGTREGFRSHAHRYCVDWGDRLGYLKLALRHRMAILPVVAKGVDDAFIGLNDGYRLGKRLGVPHGVPVWFGVGAGGLWPFCAPLPVKVVQLVGEAIEFDDLSDPATGRPVEHDDPDGLRRLHRRVARTVQDLLDAAQKIPS